MNPVSFGLVKKKKKIIYEPADDAVILSAEKLHKTLWRLWNQTKISLWQLRCTVHLFLLDSRTKIPPIRSIWIKLEFPLERKDLKAKRIDGGLFFFCWLGCNNLKHKKEQWKNAVKLLSHSRTPPRNEHFLCKQFLSSSLEKRFFINRAEDKQ